MSTSTIPRAQRRALRFEVNVTDSPRRGDTDARLLDAASVLTSTAGCNNNLGIRDPKALLLRLNV